MFAAKKDDRVIAVDIMGPLDLALDDDVSTVVVERRARPPRRPTLDLDQFASLQAELAVHPDRAPAIRARYQLVDEASQRRLEEHWQSRFAASPVERRAFAAKVAEFRRWLEGRRRPGCGDLTSPASGATTRHRP